jgi:hypothetical protein
VLTRIERVGQDLATADRLARECREGTVGWRAAWARAERATRDVVALVSCATGAEPIVQAAIRRVVG